MNFVFPIPVQFDCPFVMMEICLFQARVILLNRVFPPGFPPYFRCGLYFNAGSTRPITVDSTIPLLPESEISSL